MELQNITSAAAEVPQRPRYIFSNDALLTLSEITTYAEGDPLCWGTEGGEIVGGFWPLAEEVAKATAAAAVMLSSGQARALLVMRSFYLLGVLRGGEAYRSLVLDEEGEPEFKNIPFTLDNLAAADFVDELSALSPEYFNRLLALLGLSVPWAADAVNGGAEA